MATTTTLSTADTNQLHTLRAELKQWEKAFADANGGRKAGRHDIKQEPSIAAKYKTYGRLRALEGSSIATNSTTPPSKSDHSNAQSKRKYAAFSGTDEDGSGSCHTPRKARLEVSTPAKKGNRTSDALHPAVLDPYDSPSVFRKLFSPTTHRNQPNTSSSPSPLPLKTVIGPTPQRNGKILGLFDMLSASGGSTATPSAKRIAKLEQTAIQTPSRSKKQKKLDDIPEIGDNEINGHSKHDDDDGDDNDVDNFSISMGRTPSSSSKKLYLERLFATPTTLRFASMMEEDDNGDNNNKNQKGHRVPLSMKRLAQPEEPNNANQDPLGSETPSFLRRSNSGRYTSSNNDFGHPLSPVGVRKHQRISNGKSLTALVQGLRDMEKERMDEEWDIMNEIEAEQNRHPAEDVQVDDSQVPHNNDGNDDMPTGQSKIWRKKTQKRTTRLVKMKPVMQIKRRKPSQTAAANSLERIKTIRNSGDVGEDESEDELVHIPGENIHPNTRSLRERKHTVHHNDEEDYSDINSDNSSDQDFTEEPASSKEQPLPQLQRKPLTSSFTEKIKAAFSSSVSTTKTKEKNKKVPNATEQSPKKRKVNPDAHANYRSLKIRSRGQGRFRKGRFGRR